MAETHGRLLTPVEFIAMRFAVLSRTRVPSDLSAGT